MPIAPSEFTRRVSFDGRHDVDARTRSQINAVEGILGHAVVMYQGSWSNSPLSAGTHSGPGAADIGPTGPVTWRQLEAACRCVGLAAWFRPWPNNYHVHCESIGNPFLPWLAALQVNAYKAGFDGLGANARAGHDTGIRLYARMGVTWESYQQQHKLPDIQPPAPPTKRATMKGFWRGKDFTVAADGKWHTVPINDAGDVSFGTAPGMFSGIIKPNIKTDGGGTVYFRLSVDDVDDRTGKVRSSQPSEVLAKLLPGTGIASIPFLQNVAAPGKGIARRLRVQVQVRKPTTFDRLGVVYTKN